MTFLNGLVSGVALGAIYALIALGYVIVYRSTHILNFAQGAILTLGAYIVYLLMGPAKGTNFANPPSLLRLPYFVAIVLAMVLMAGFGWALETLVIRRFRGRPVFALIMATLGVGIILSAVKSWIWGTSPVNLDLPFGDKFFRIGGTDGLAIKYIDVFTFVLVGVIAVLFFFAFERSRLGTAMRATAADQEAAIAQGISPNVIFGMSWAISCALATLAGVLLASGAGSVASPQVSPSLGAFALVGFPAIVLGGVDSPGGAILGGGIIGIAQVMAGTYEPTIAPYVGTSFSTLVPYILMIMILVVKPSGLFGTKEVRRV
jgi:branched-chain amino acid transport system permease protein